MSDLGGAGGGSATFDINVEVGDLNRLETAAADAFGGMVSQAKKGASALDEVTKNLGTKAAKTLGSAGTKAGQEFAQGVSAGAKSSAKAIDALIRDLDAAARTSASRSKSFSQRGLDPGNLALFDRQTKNLINLTRELETNRAEAIKSPKVLNAYKEQATSIRTSLRQEGAELLQIQKNNTAQLANATAASTTKIDAQRAGQLQINAAKVAGQQRVAVTRATLETIGRLEKGFITLITGTARTATSALSKIYSGTVGSLQRSFSERRSVITRNLNSESRLFTEQSIKIQRLQAEANRGLTGAVSRNAGLFGGGFLALGAIQQTFKLGSDFSRGLNVLQAQLDLTAEQMDSVSKLSIKLGNDISLPGVSALDAAQAIAVLGKQFGALGPAAITAANAAAKGTLQLARATGAASEDAAQVVGAAVNVFGVAADQATRVADSFAGALTKAGSATFDDLSLAFRQGASVFNSFQTPVLGAKLSVDTFLASIAILAKGGLVGSDAGTSLKNFFLQATRNTDEANAAIGVLLQRAGETGTLFNTAAGAARPFGEALEILRKGTAGLSDEQRNQALQTIFGTDAFRAADILIRSSAQDLFNITAAIGKEGTAAKLAAAQNKGLAGALDALKSQFQTFAILIFRQVQPVLATAGLALAGFIDNLANGEGVFAVVRQGLKGIAIGLGAIVAARGAVEVLSLVARFAALALTPFGALVVVAGAVGAAIAIAAKRSASFRETLEKIRDAAVQVGGVLRDRLLAGFEAVRGFIDTKVNPVLERFRDALADRIAPATEAIRKLATTIITFLTPAAKVLQNFFFTAVQGFQRLTEGNFSQALSDFKFLGQQILSGIGAAFSKIDFSQIGRALSTNLGRSLSGAGLGAVAGGVLAGPLGAALGAAFGAAVGLALPRIRSAIASIDVPSLFGKFLDGVRLVGRKIGEIISDKRFILGVAGIAAAAAAIAVQFVSGFVSGILSNLGDIRAAGAKILQALFDAPAVVKAVAALGLLLRGALTGQFQKAGIGKAIGAVFAGDFEEEVVKRFRTVGLADRLKAAFTSIGKGLGQAITIGLSAALSGSALGSATSGLDTALGIAGIGGSIAAAFAVGGPPAAALAGGVALVSTALSAQAKSAKEAAERMQVYVSALKDATSSGKSAEDAILGVADALLSGANEAVLKDFKELGITIDDFQKALAAGQGQEFLKNVVDQLFKTRGAFAGTAPAVQFMQQQINALASASERVDLEKTVGGAAEAARGGGLVFQQLTGFAERAGTAIRQAIAANVEETNKKRVEGLKQAADTLRSAADKARASLEALITGQSQTAEQAGQQAVVDLPGIAASVAEATKTGVNTAFGSAQLATGLAPFKQDLNTIVQNAISDGVSKGLTPEQVQGNIDTAFGQVTAAIGQLGLAPEAALPLIQEINRIQNDPAINQLKLQIQTEEAQAKLFEFKAAVATAFGDTAENVQAAFAQTQSTAATTGADIGGQVAAGVASTTGLFTNIGASMASSLTAGIGGGNAQAAGATAGQQAAAGAQAQTGLFSSAGATMASTLAAALGGGGATSGGVTAGSQAAGGARSQAGLFSGIGSQMASLLSSGLSNGSAAAGGAAAGAQAAAGARKSVGLFSSIGAQMAAGLTGGIRAAAGNVAAAAANMVTAAVNSARAAAQIKSPSKVFMGIGEDIVQGLVEGIAGSTADAVSAMNNVVEALIDSTRTVAQRVGDALSAGRVSLFESIFGDTPERAAADAQASITTSFRGVINQVRSNAEELFSIAASDAAGRSLGDQLKLGESFTSLRAGDEFGVANRQALEQAVDAIADIGKALLQQGLSADAAAQQVAAYRDQLISTAVSAGLAADQVAQFISSIGLSDAGISRFLQTANQLNAITSAAQNRVITPALAPPLQPGPNGVQQFFEAGSIVVAPPHGDPEAIALTVVNKIALRV